MNIIIDIDDIIKTLNTNNSKELLPLHINELIYIFNESKKILNKNFKFQTLFDYDPGEYSTPNNFLHYIHYS